jgi:flagellar protein FliO/FliZ
MKILDRMPLSKENSLLITKIGEKGYVISSTQNRVEILKELDEDELRKIEESKIIMNM